MGLKCSLLGHEYGEPETEREREERGDEVVETVRTVEYCERCGKERVVSENTEVRSIRQAPTSLAGDRDAPAADASEASATTETAGGGADGAETESAPSGESSLASAVERVENESESAEAESDAGDDGPATDFDVEADATAEEDDAVILTDDGEEVAPERGRGEWPASDDTREGDRPDGEPESASPPPSPSPDDAADDDGAEPPETEDDAVFIDETVDAESDGDGDASTAWPDQDGSDEGFSAEPATAGGADVSFGGGLTPEEETGGASGESSADEGVDPRGGIASAGPIDTDRRSESANTDGDELVCPECGVRTAVTGSSLRAGDICPECHRGYLAEAPESA